MNSQRETELLQEIKALRAVSSSQQALLAAIPDIVMQVDIDKVYTWANQAGYEFFGEDVIGKEASYYFEGEQNTYERIRSLFEGDENVIYLESWQRRKDGKKRFLAWWCRVVKDVQGNVTGAISTARDITKRKSAEQNLKKNEALLREVINSMEKAIAIYEAVDDGADFVFVDMNEFGEKITQYSIEDVRGRRISELFPGEPTVGLIAKLRETWKTGTSTQIPLKQYQDDRITQWVENYIFKLPSGKVVALFEDTFEKREAEKKLQKSEARFRSLLESAPIAIITTDKNSKIEIINSKTEKMFGYSRDELLGQSIGFLMPERFRQAHANHIAKFFSAPESRAMGNDLEIFGLHKDGSEIPVEVGLSFVETEEGILGMSFISDITERVRAEDEIKNLARFPFENPNPIMRVTNEGQLIYANPSSRGLQEMWGCETGETLPDDWKLMISESVASGSGHVQDVQCNERIFSIMVAPVQSAGYVNLYASDITERKYAEDALRESEKKLKILFEILPVGISVLNKDREIVFLNKALERILNITQAGLLRGDYRSRKYFHPDKTPMLVEEFASSLAISEKRAVNDVETGVEKEDGTIVWASVSAIPVPFQDWSVVIVTSDITDRMQAEQELKRSNTELEQFAYVASHDLQEPLRAVAGMLQLLQLHYQSKLDERADEYIKHAVEASKRMQNLINDLLAYSRVDRGSTQLVPTDVHKVLDAALANLTVVVRESNASVTHDSLPTITADPTLLMQVFQNLIGNAIKFQGERAPEIHIGAHELENAWRFEVRDNGIGIEPQYHQRIFKIFQRLHGRREYPGTGIGLSLCQKIIESWGGRIWVESEEGQGSRFFFTIPHRS